MGDSENQIGGALQMRSDFDVFLSHSSKDKPAARELKAVLESKNLTVWFDEEQLRPGVNWQPLLEQGLQRAGCVMVAIVAAGMGPWQSEETEAALIIAKTLQRPVIPVLLPTALDGEPTIGLFLQSRMWVDLRSGYSDDVVGRLVWGVTGEKPGQPATPQQLQNAAASKWILVAGSGGLTPIPDGIERLSKNLGSALATAGFNLVTGGWNGVDDFVARAFAGQALQNGLSLSGRLVAIMRHDALPHFPAGRLVAEGSEDDAWRRSVERADAVVLIGGMGGTYGTGELALQLGKYVFPIADTRSTFHLHADAYNFYFRILKSWGKSEMAGIMSEDEFSALSNPSSMVVPDVIKLLKKIPNRT